MERKMSIFFFDPMFYPKLQANGYYSICKFTKVSKAYNSERHLYFTMKQLVEGRYFFFPMEYLFFQFIDLHIGI